MKEIGNFRIRISAVCLAVVIIAMVAAGYILLLNNAVSDNIGGTISEIAGHDRGSIQNYIEETWTELEYIEKKIVSYSCDTILDAEALMNVECSNSRFSHIYLVAENGLIYTDKLLTYDPGSEGQNGRIELLSYFADDADHIVTRFDDKIVNAGITKESILYGIKLDRFYIEGVHMIGLVGISDINNIQDRLVINSFTKNGESHGYSAVIDMNGNYIVNERRTVYVNETDNFFDRIANAQSSELTGSDISDKMSVNETFSFSYTNADGVDKIIYFMPFEDINVQWYFLLSVERSVFNEQNSSLLLISMSMLVIILVVVVVLLLYIMSVKSKVIAANAEAKAKSQFLANMSHEIRTPLNGIIGLIYLIEKDIDHPDKHDIIKSRLSKEESTANYLLSLINNILDLSKLQSGKVELNKDAISPEIIADAIWSMQKNNIESRGVEFRVNCDIVVPWIIGDDILIKRVLMNVVGNAAKFTPEGGRITLSVTQRQNDKTHVTTIFTCTDTGCGMSSEFLKHIWDNFSQECCCGENLHVGTGLGMSISKLLINAMGGEIDVKSKLGEGSTFIITLPSEIAEEPPKHAHSDDGCCRSGERQLKILLAEDNELNAEILTDILESNGFEVVRAEDGSAAAEIFRTSDEGEFDIILMDMQMPVMDGCTAAAEIRGMDRADAKSILILACTANSFKEDRKRALASGMDDFISKPVNVNEMLEKLQDR